MHNIYLLLIGTVLLFAGTTAVRDRCVGGVLPHQPGSPCEVRDSIQLQQGTIPTGEQAAAFSAVEWGIVAGNVGPISSFFGIRVFVQLRGTEGGYFSAAQSYYILETFLRGKRFVSARFTTYGKSDSSPYATGSAAFIIKGKREDARMYVALSPAGEHWVISHLSIY